MSTSTPSLSFDEIKDLLRAAIRKADYTLQDYGPWLKDVYTDYCVYEDYDTPAMYKRTYSIDSANTVTLGDAVQVIEKTTYETVVKMSSASFSGGEASPSDDWVVRTGKVFEIGAYADKGFSVTAEEADAAITAFKPVSLELEHFDSKGEPHIFSGKLGTLERVWRDGTALMGSVKVPPWTDQPWSEYGRKVSTVWNIANKTLERCGLVLEPRVADAAMLTAFTAFTQARASAQTTPATSTPKEKPKMSLKDSWNKFFNTMSAEERGQITAEELAQFGVVPATAQPSVPAPTAVPHPAASGQKSAREIELERQVATMSATQFVDAVRRDKRVTPALEADAIAMLSAVISLEAERPQLVTFTRADKTEVKSSLTDLVKGFLGALPQHALLGERAPSELAASLPGAVMLSGSTDPADPFQQGMEYGKAWSVSQYGDATAAGQQQPSQNGR